MRPATDNGAGGVSPAFLADPSRDASASLHLIHDQFLFEYGPASKRRQKGGSPEAVEQAFSGADFDTGWLGPDVVRSGRGLVGEWVVSYLAPARRVLTILDDEARAARVAVPLPGLVLFGLGREWYVWAVKTRSRFDPKALAYLAPTPNVGEGGRICFGEFSVPVATPRATDAAWAAFLDTPFNDHDVRGRSLGEPDDVRRLLVGLGTRRAA